MRKVISIADYLATKMSRSTAAQLGADKRAKVRSVLLRLKADQNLAKIRFSEGLSWRGLTEILYEFIDWHRVNCYIMGNLRAA